MNIFSKEKLNDSLSLSGECDAYSPKTASQINLTRGQWFKYDKSLQEMDNMLRRSTFTLEEVQSMLADHIVFNNHYPVGKSIVGDHLLCDGIFHQIWGKMLKNHNICLNFAVYYEMFVNKITTNANNFQSFYNDESNWPDQLLAQAPDQKDQLNSDKEDSNTNSSRKPKQIITDTVQLQQENAPVVDPLQQSSQNLLFPSADSSPISRYLAHNPTPLSLQHIFWLQLTCTMLNLNNIYSMNQIQIIRICQNMDNQLFDLFVIEAYVPTTTPYNNRKRLEMRPRVLVGTHRLFGIEQLFRVERTYGKVFGAVLHSKQDINQHITDSLPRW